MLSMLLNKKTKIFLLVSSLVFTNTITFFSTKKMYISENVIPGYRVEFRGNYSDNTEKYMLLPSISNIGDIELGTKINATLSDVFVRWLPEKFKYPDLTYLDITLSTNRFFSSQIVYTFTGRRTENMYICNTINMKTGDIAYLDDLIEVDEEFAKMILTEGISKVEFDWNSGEYNVDYPHLSDENYADVLEKLRMCSDPFNEDNWIYKPTFYLQNNRLYLLNIFNDESKCYIELDKIQDKLKVDKW
ncbi:hypothetical protein ABFV83_11280 [Lacrimispora sp. BS-2]|uniref:Uncharacterized protein n=1 Tax=Lacrimispora sp. BS-2 TaxID=3151850 RepID=A0AAU7PJR2_9FIRM